MQIMDMLRLSHIQGEMVGDFGHGLTNLQKRRVTIAIELVADPTVILLDVGSFPTTLTHIFLEAVYVCLGFVTLGNICPNPKFVCHQEIGLSPVAKILFLIFALNWA